MNRKRIDQFTLMDDIYMEVFFTGQKDCVELVIRAILDKPDLMVESMETQHHMTKLDVHSSRIDILAVDTDGKRYDIEIQNKKERATPRRARYYASLLDNEVLPKRTDYEDLPESYVIFITAGDALGFRLPVVHVDRIAIENLEPVDDGSHYIFVDATYNYDQDMPGELGDIMHDFLCADSAQMRCPLLAERTRQVKDPGNKEASMEFVSDVIFNEGIEQGREESIARLVASGLLTAEQIAEVFGVTTADVERYAMAASQTVSADRA